jgi:hypothetical protein
LRNAVLKHGYFILVSAMNTVTFIDEPGPTRRLTEADKTAQPPARISHSPKRKSIMNAKLLFVTTVALAVVSSFAQAQQATPLSSAEVRAEYRAAAANHTLRSNEYDFGARDFAPAAGTTRAAVLADMAQARRGNTLVGPMRNRTYNPAGAEALRPSNVTRNEVKSDVSAAARSGSLRHSDYDDVPVTVSRRLSRERTAPSLVPAVNRNAG